MNWMGILGTGARGARTGDMDEAEWERQGGYGWELTNYILMLISMGLAAFLYSGALDYQLDNALIPQRITTPCTMLFVLLALIFFAMGIAERSPPPEIYKAQKKARLEAINKWIDEELAADEEAKGAGKAKPNNDPEATSKVEHSTEPEAKQSHK